LLSVEAFLKDNEESIVALNMIVHVSKDKQDETKLLKTVLSPID